MAPIPMSTRSWMVQPWRSGGVPDRDLVAEGGGMRVAHHVDDGAVLEVGAGSDADAVDVSANDDVHPDARGVANLDIADDLRHESECDDMRSWRDAGHDCRSR